MDRFLIILLPQKVHIYKSIENNEFEVFYINGEAVLDWSMETYHKDFVNLKTEIIDTCNLDDLSELGFDVIYHQVHTDIIKQLSDTLLPCAWWQIFSFEKILPELLLKMKKIKPDKSVIVEFENSNYLVYMSNEGVIQNCISDKKGELNIDVKSIPKILKKSYKFITNEEDIKKKDLELINALKENQNLNVQINLLEKEINAINIRYNKVECELDKKNRLLKTYEVERSKKNIISKRNIVRVIEPKKDTVTMSGWLREASRVKKLNIKWRVNDGMIISSNKEIAIIQDLNSDRSVYDVRSIYNNSEGRIFIMTNDNEEVKEGQRIAVISDPADSKDDIRKWLIEMENKEDTNSEKKEYANSINKGFGIFK